MSHPVVFNLVLTTFSCVFWASVLRLVARILLCIAFSRTFACIIVIVVAIIVVGDRLGSRSMQEKGRTQSLHI